MGNKDFNVDIHTKADTKGARETKKALGDIKNKADDVGKNPGLGKMKKGLDAVGQSGGKLGKVVSWLKSVPGPVKIAAAALGTLAVAFKTLSNAIKAYAEQEVVNVELEAALRNQGLLTHENIRLFHELASAKAEIAGSDEEWLKILADLTKFGADTNNIEQYAEAVENLAGLMNGNLMQASEAVKRASQGNFQMFSRLGIVIEKTGDQTKDLQNLFNQLARGEGILAAKAKTLEGQKRKLKNASDDLKQAFGKLWAQTGIVQKAAGFLEGTLRILEKVFPSVAQKTSDLKNKLPGLNFVLKDIAESSDEMADGLKKAGSQSLDGVKKSADQLGKKLDSALDKIDRLRKRKDEVQEAKFDLEEAGIERDEASGDISEEEASRKKADLRYRREAARLANEENALLKEKAAIEESLVQKTNQQKQAHEATISAIEKAKALAKALSEFRSEDVIVKEIEKQRGVVKEFEKFRGNLRGNLLKQYQQQKSRLDKLEKELAQRTAIEGETVGAEKEAKRLNDMANELERQRRKQEDELTPRLEALEHKRAIVETKKETSQIKKGTDTRKLDNRQFEDASKELDALKKEFAKLRGEFVKDRAEALKEKAEKLAERRVEKEERDVERARSREGSAFGRTGKRRAQRSTREEEREAALARRQLEQVQSGDMEAIVRSLRQNLQEANRSQARSLQQLADLPGLIIAGAKDQEAKLRKLAREIKILRKQMENTRR